MRHNFKRNKYNNKKTVRDGITFDSQKEARYYDSLKLLQKAGHVVGFFRQVPFDLPGGIKYRTDFLVFYSSGDCEAVEVKGFETPEWKIKHKQVLELYPWVTLKVIK